MDLIQIASTRGHSIQDLYERVAQYQFLPQIKGHVIKNKETAAFIESMIRNNVELQENQLATDIFKQELRLANLLDFAHYIAENFCNAMVVDLETHYLAYAKHVVKLQTEIPEAREIMQNVSSKNVQFAHDCEIKEENLGGQDKIKFQYKILNLLQALGKLYFD